MQIRISPGDGAPVYQQIVNQVKYLAASGQLAPGDELPTIRELAEQLLVNPNTVARSYRELEAEGIVATNRGGGTRIAEMRSPLALKERRRILAEGADLLLTRAAQLNVDLDELIRIVRQRADLMNREGKGK